MDSMKARLTGTQLQLDIISLEQNLVAIYVLLPDEDISFFFYPCCCESAWCTSSMGKVGRNQAKCAVVDGRLTSSFMDFKGLFLCFVEDGEFFGVVTMFSLLHSSRPSPPKGTFGNHIRLWGKGRQSPLSFTHSSSHTWQIHACSTSRFYLLTKFYFPSVSVYIA